MTETDIPIEEVLDKREIKRLEFKKWQLGRTPEDQTPRPQEVVDWQKFRRREKLKQLMRQ